MSTHRARRRLLVTGCGRSATKYIAFVCRRLGLEVPHERLGRDGIASWTMAAPARARRFGPPSGTCSFDHVFHQIRHPLSVIASVRSFEPESWRFICTHTPCSPDEPLALRAALYWLHWNELAEHVAEWRYRIEALEEVFDVFCERIGIPFDASVLDRVPTNVNTRVHGRVFHRTEELFERLRLDMPVRLRAGLERRPTAEDDRRFDWDDLEALDGQLALRIRAKAAAYGYCT